MDVICATILDPTCGVVLVANPPSIPRSFACWMSPVIGIVYAWRDWSSPTTSAAENQRWHDMSEAIQMVEPSSGGELGSGFAAS